ncbi:MAG: D-alanine-D-alanine ligase [Myxococcales bacterium]|jgi:D-alanine-D-alanine ligase|nr:D-alanine-D-alanine ligase [Myxococcales bacterium]
MTGHRKIGVLLGGLSGERDVSIRSGEAIVAALVERGHDAVPVFVDRDIDLVLRQMRIDVAFLALHGRYGEDGCVQGLLEVLGIPYTGSGVLASALAMNKAKTKEILRLHNLPTAPGYVIAADSGEDLIESHGSFGFPVVVKPSGEGSSLGVTVARDEMELESAVEEAIRFDDDVLVERFVEGKEISVGVLDGKVLGAVEIVPRRGFYDFQNKYTAGRSDYYFPARLSPERYRSVLRLGTLAFEALGCEGAARIDLIVSERGNEIILEVNTLPGMTPTSLMPKIAHGAGLSFEDLVEEILKGARLRAHGHRRDRRAVQVELQGPERRTGFLPEAH